MEPAVDSGKDRRPAVVESEVGVGPDRVRHENVGGLVGEDAAGEAKGEKAPVSIGARGRWSRLRDGQSRSAEGNHRNRQENEYCARKS
jgi:hypothetical protein